MRKYIKLFEEFVFEYLSKASKIINNISELPKVGEPVDKLDFKEDGIVAIDWKNLVFIRSSDELPTLRGKDMLLHTGKALKSVGFNDSFEKYLKKKYNNDINDPENTWIKEEPHYKDFETFRKWMIDAHSTRWTKHFTLNHVVSSHSGGNWTGNKYIYLMPGESMIKTNGKPASLFAIDTYYDKSLVVSDGTVVLYLPEAEEEVREFVSKTAENRNQIYFLKIKGDIVDYELQDANNAIEAMGYTTFSGGSHYSTDDNLDSEMRDLQDREDIRKSGLHWGSKWYNLEKGQTNWEDFMSLGKIKRSQYKNLDIKKEEQEYQAHRGFSKDYLKACVKYLSNDHTEDPFDKEVVRNYLRYMTMVCKIIATPKFSMKQFDETAGFIWNNSDEHALSMDSWDPNKLESELDRDFESHPEYTRPERYSYGTPEQKEVMAKRSNEYIGEYYYFNKYLLFDIKQAFKTSWIGKFLQDNRKELEILQDIIIKKKESPEWEEAAGKIADRLVDSPVFPDLLNIGSYLIAMNRGAKKYGYKDVYDMLEL
jgi:hypothetical protein